MKTNERQAMEKLREYRERVVEIFIETLKLFVAKDSHYTETSQDCK